MNEKYKEFHKIWIEIHIYSIKKNKTNMTARDSQLKVGWSLFLAAFK
jgi:hypothetical protein